MASEEILLLIHVSDTNIRKVKMPYPDSLDEFVKTLSTKLGISIGKEQMAILDPDFQEYIVLDDYSMIKHLSKLKVLPAPNIIAPTSESQSVEDNHLEQPQDVTGSGHLPWPKDITIPTFDIEVETFLQESGKEFTATGQLATVTPSMKSKILGKLSSFLYGYAAYPTNSQYDQVATALVAKHPCLKDNVKPSLEAKRWKISLAFRMGNLRRDLAKLQVQEVCINKKSSSSKKTTPKAVGKKGFTNYLPPLEKEKIGEDLRLEIRQEWLKTKRNTTTTAENMTKTFALRRKEIVDLMMSVSEIVDRWPALFCTSQVYCEFHRLTGVDLKSFFDSLDKMTPAIYHFMNKRQQQLVANATSELPVGPQKDRTGALLGLPLLLGESFETMVDIKEDDVSEDEACSELRPPHILAIRLQQYVVIIDQTVCSDESSCMEHAMAIFFGLHYLLDLKYQTKLQNTLTFVQKHMLELASDDMPSRVFCLSQKICRFQAQHA